MVSRLDPISTGHCVLSLRISSRTTSTIGLHYFQFTTYPCQKYAFRYTEEISEDNTFALELRCNIRHAASILLVELKKIEFGTLFMEDVLPIVVLHVERVCRIVRDREIKVLS